MQICPAILQLSHKNSHLWKEVKGKATTADYQSHTTAASVSILWLQRAGAVWAAHQATQEPVSSQGTVKVGPFCSVQS